MSSVAETALKPSRCKGRCGDAECQEAFSASQRAAMQSGYDQAVMTISKAVQHHFQLLDALKEFVREAESWHSVHEHDAYDCVQCDSICELIAPSQALIAQVEQR